MNMDPKEKRKMNSFDISFTSTSRSKSARDIGVVYGDVITARTA